jgi:hypothetical protein
MAFSNSFDRAIERLGPGTPAEAIIEVCDTAGIAKLWFEANNMVPLAADIVSLTDIIMRRHAERCMEAEQEFQRTVAGMQGA